jgi:tetratricopeptide (TPR) repeat protein
MSERPQGDPKTHPETEALQRFLRGETTSRESAEILTHLVTGCDRCRRVTRAVWRRRSLPGRQGTGAPELHPSSYAGLWPRARKARRIHEKLLAADRRKARRLCRELIELPARERLPRVCGDDRFRSLHLAAELTRQSLWHRPDEPRESLDLAEVAVAVAERVDARSFGETTVHDLEAMAWSALGSARRRLGDLESAERALRVAGLLLREGSGDPLERARLLLLEAALRRHRHRFRDALARVRRAEASHGRLGDEPLLGRILIERGRIETCLGDLEAAVTSLHRGLRSLDAERHAREVFDTRVALGHRLLDLGRTAQAMLELRSATGFLAPGSAGASPTFTTAAPGVQNRPFEIEPETPPKTQEEIPPHLLELRRLEGRIALARGDYAQAERRLREVWRQHLARRRSRRALRAALDLAEVYRRQDPEKLRRFGRDLEELGWSGLLPAERPSFELLRAVAEEAGRPTGLLPLLAGHLDGRPALPGPPLSLVETSPPTTSPG